MTQRSLSDPHTAHTAHSTTPLYTPLHLCIPHHLLQAIDLRSNEALPVRVMERISNRLIHDDDGHRIVICRPPRIDGPNNPVTRKSNREQGIRWQGNAVLVPRVFPPPDAVRKAADRVLEGNTLYLAREYDGAGWCMIQLAKELLEQLERDKNLLQLPEGAKRVLQLIYDGHGFTGRIGAVRFVLRCPQTDHNHNIRRNGRDPIFLLGTDKHHDLELAVAIGDEHSMKAHFFKGLCVTVYLIVQGCQSMSGRIWISFRLRALTAKSFSM